MITTPSLRLLAAALCLALLSACNVMPQLERPVLKLPTEFKGAGIWQMAKPSAHEKRGDWWTKLGDAKLNTLMNQAAKANPPLQLAAARLDEAQALARADRSALLTLIGITSSVRRARGSGAVALNFGGGRTITRQRSTLDVGYEFDLWARGRNTARSSAAQAQAMAADYQTALLSLQAELAMNYLALQAQDEAISVLKRSAELRRQGLELAKARFKQGDSAQLDVALAETELSDTETEAIGLEGKRAELEHAIALLLGTTPPEFALPAMSLRDSVPNLPRSVPSSLLERRPDIAAAEAQMASMNAEVGVAKAALFPNVRLGVTGGSESSITSRLLSTAARVWGLGPELQWDVLSMGRNQARVDAARARYDQSAAQYRGAVLSAIREVEDALSNLDVLNRQRAAQGRTVAAARTAADLAQKRYDAGLVAYYEVLDAQRSLLRTELAETTTGGELWLATVKLAKALGGSW